MYLFGLLVKEKGGGVAWSGIISDVGKRSECEKLQGQMFMTMLHMYQRTVAELSLQMSRIEAE